MDVFHGRERYAAVRYIGFTDHDTGTFRKSFQTDDLVAFQGLGVGNKLHFGMDIFPYFLKILQLSVDGVKLLPEHGEGIVNTFMLLKFMDLRHMKIQGQKQKTKKCKRFFEDFETGKWTGCSGKTERNAL